MRGTENRVELMTFVTSFFTWCLTLSAVSAEDGGPRYEIAAGAPGRRCLQDNLFELGKVTVDLT